MNKFESPNLPKTTQEQMEENDGRLDEEEAHEIANMMRAYLQVNPKSERELSKRDYSTKELRKATPEDCDRALKAVEEIQRLAEEETATTKVLYKFGRILHKVVKVPEAAIIILDSILMINHPEGSITEDVIQMDKSLQMRLADAAKKLEKLKELSGQYVETELKKHARKEAEKLETDPENES